LYLKREMGDTFCLACGPYCFTTVVSTLGWYHLRFEIRCEGKMIFWKSKKIILKKFTVSFTVSKFRIYSVNPNMHLAIFPWAKCGLNQKQKIPQASVFRCLREIVVEIIAPQPHNFMQFQTTLKRAANYCISIY
jgi:hypothetical protein